MAATINSVAVVSCHVERILDDRVWQAYRTFVAKRHGGFVVASLVRPPDLTVGEDEALWLDRVRQLRETGPIGHHTHWTSPDHARPVNEADAGGRVLREGEWLRAQGVAATCFCGGGWFSDGAVASVCASFGYVDCTPRVHRPPHLAEGGAWAQLAGPAFVQTSAGPVLSIPTTHSLGELARLVVRPRRIDTDVVHGYFHDTDLLDGRRRRALAAALLVLGRRRTPSDLDAVAATVRQWAGTVLWSDVARGGAVDQRQ